MFIKCVFQTERIWKPIGNLFTLEVDPNNNLINFKPFVERCLCAFGLLCFLLLFLYISFIGVHMLLYPLLWHMFSNTCLLPMVLNIIRTDSGFTVFSSHTHRFCKCIFGCFIFSPASTASTWFVIMRISLWCELRMSHRFQSNLRKSNTIALIRQFPWGITFFVVIT